MSDYPYFDPVARLLELGDPDSPWPDYPALYGLTSEHIPELIRMAIDESTWEDEDNVDAEMFRNIHAYRALGQLQAVEAIPALLSIMRWSDDYDDEWTSEEMPQVFALIGPAAISPLADYLADTQHELWARSTAASSLNAIAQRFQESAPVCVANLARTLSEYEQNDPDLNASLVVELAELHQPETYFLVEQAYQAGRVEESVMGDWEDFQIKVGLIEKRTTPKQNPLREILSPGPSLFNPPGSRTGGKASKKEKAKRKQAAKSRKKK
jgi:hypothetical protein